MRFLACAIGAVVLTSVVVQAQWPTYKTQGVPRTKSGEVNLAAPAPKARAVVVSGAAATIVNAATIRHPVTTASVS